MNHDPYLTITAIDGPRLEKLIPGDDIDGQVAWYVFGCCPHPPKADHVFFEQNTQSLREYRRVQCGICGMMLDTEHWRPRPPRYSLLIADAWALVGLYRLTVHPTLNKWEVVDCNWEQSGEINAVGTTNGRAWYCAPTAPMAICIAALAIAKGRRRFGVPPIPGGEHGG